MAPGQTDFFRGSIDECDEGFLPDSLCNAPYYHTEAEGDFVPRVKASHYSVDCPRTLHVALTYAVFRQDQNELRRWMH